MYLGESTFSLTAEADRRGLKKFKWRVTATMLPLMSLPAVPYIHVERKITYGIFISYVKCSTFDRS